MSNDVIEQFPSTLGECADKYQALRMERLALQKTVDAIEEKEKALRAYLIEQLPLQIGASGVAGTKARVSIVTRIVPHVSDWEALYNHIGATGNFSLLSRAASAASVKDVWNEGGSVPGVEAFTLLTLSVNKI